LGGAVFAGFGLWLFWKTLGNPSSLSGALPRQRLGRAGQLAAGAFFLLSGSFLAAVKAAAGLRRGSGALGPVLGLETAQETFGERAGRVWGWVIVLAFLAFGAYLIRTKP
jgi:hypothetical protein